MMEVDWMGNCTGCKGKVRQRNALWVEVDRTRLVFCCRGCAKLYEYEHGVAVYG